MAMRTILVLSLLCAACAASPTPEQQTDVAGWGGADGVCINHASSRAQADYCRDQLRELFCRPDGGILFDSGACVNVTLSNGMRP